MRNSQLHRIALLAIALCGIASAAATEIKIGGDRRIRLTEDWRFLKGEAKEAEAPGFDDSSWRKVNLPHDYSIEGPTGKDPASMDGPFDKASPAGAGRTICLWPDHRLPAHRYSWYLSAFPRRRIAVH